MSLVLFTDFHKLFGNHKNQIMSRIMKNMLKESRIFITNWCIRNGIFLFSHLNHHFLLLFKSKLLKDKD